MDKEKRNEWAKTASTKEKVKYLLARGTRWTATFVLAVMILLIMSLFLPPADLGLAFKIVVSYSISWVPIIAFFVFLIWKMSKIEHAIVGIEQNKQTLTLSERLRKFAYEKVAPEPKEKEKKEKVKEIIPKGRED